MRQKTIIIDSNLWISFLISNRIIFIESLLRKHEITILFSNDFIVEFVDVALRKKFRKYFKEDRIEVALEILKRCGMIITVKTNVDLCRDPKDNFLLNLSIDGKADFLNTGDKDLLVLKKVENTEIITLAEFKKNII